MDGIEKVDADGEKTAVEKWSDADELVRELVRLHPDLRARARFLTRGSAAAEDLVQDVLERALMVRDRLRPHTNVKAWLTAIMRNLFIDERRRRRSLPDRPLAADLWTRGEPPGPLDLITMDDVLDALALLQPIEREVFTLAYLERLSYREIAARLQVPVNTAATRLFRARKKLRRLLTQVYLARDGGWMSAV